MSRTRRTASTQGVLQRGLQRVRAAAATVRDDLDAALERDPAARSRLEIAALYPGVHAVWSHRVSNAMWRRGAKFPARALSQATRFATNIEIHPGATLGPRLFIDHGAGVVIGETAVVGRDVTLFHGVTLGGTTFDAVKRHPTLGDGVLVGAGAKLLGAIDVGEGARVGSNAVVLKDVPAGAVVVGVPGQVLAANRGQRPADPHHPDPGAGAAGADPVGGTVKDLVRRVELLEGSSGGGHGRPFRDDGVWEYDDYAI